MQLGHKFHGGQIELVAVVGGQNRPEIAFVGGIEAGVGSCLGREKVRLHHSLRCGKNAFIEAKLRVGHCLSGCQLAEQGYKE